MRGRGERYRTPRDPPQQTAEDERVDRQHPVPIESAGNATRIEGRRLADERSLSVAKGRHAELEPASPRQLQSRRQPQETVRLVGLYAPPVYDVADTTGVGIAAMPRHARSAQKAVEPSAQPPQCIAEIPPSAAADTSNGCERLRRWCIDDNETRVDLLLVGRVLFDRAHESLAQRHRLDFERLARRRRMHDRGIA